MVGKYAKCRNQATKVQFKHAGDDSDSDEEELVQSDPNDRPESSYEDQYEAGVSALRNGSLQSAERNFASALRTVHGNEEALDKEASCLCRLGDVYVAKGKNIGDGKCFSQAASLYNGALVRTDDATVKVEVNEKLKDTEAFFIHHVVHTDRRPSLSDVDRGHKEVIQNTRENVRQRLESIDQKFNLQAHREDHRAMTTVEAQRADAIKDLFVEIAQNRKEFVAVLVDECMEVLGPAPCTYAVIGLGSQATETVTPYSDLEFAILLDEGCDTDENKQYFRHLTNYVHLKVINLGETIIPAMAIKSLNDFESDNPADNWFYDSETPRGFAFDGSMPWASKTPLGRDKTRARPALELIRSPSCMAELQQGNIAVSEGYHLSDILRNVCCLTGDDGLVDEYMKIVNETLTSTRRREGSVSVIHAGETLAKDVERYGKQGLTAKLLDVKKDIYRFPTISIDSLCVLCGLKPGSVWKVISDMEESNILTRENADHLKVLVSISAELRLRTYLANGKQWETMSALSPIATDGQTGDHDAAFKSVFYLPDDDMLFSPFIIKTLTNIAAEWEKLGESQKAIKHNEEALEMCETVSGPGKENPMVVDILDNLAATWNRLGDYEKAIQYLEQSLKTNLRSWNRTKMAAEVIAGRIPLSTRSKSDTSVHDGDRRDSVKSDTSSTVGHRRAGRPQDRTTRRRSVAVMDLGNQPRKPVQAFKTSLGGSLLASRRGTAAFRSMFLPKLDAEPEEPKIPGIVRFRKAAGVVRLLCMVCIVCRKILSQTIIEGSWLAMVESILQEAEESAKKAESQSKGSGQLSFDPHKFRRSGKNEVKWGKGRGGEGRGGEGRGGKGRDGKGREGKGREGKGREGKGREGWEGKGREGKGREGKGREEKGGEGRGRDGTGREGTRRRRARARAPGSSPSTRTSSGGPARTSGGRGGEGRGGEGRGGKGREGKGREGKGREGKGREEKGGEGRGRDGTGRDGTGRHKKAESQSKGSGQLSFDPHKFRRSGKNEVKWGKGRGGEGRGGKGREGKGREGKGREEKGGEGTGRDGTGRHKKAESQSKGSRQLSFDPHKFRRSGKNEVKWGKGRGGEGREGRGGEGRGGEGRGGEGRGGEGGEGGEGRKEGKGREGKGGEGRRREGTGRDGTGRHKKAESQSKGLRAALLRPAQVQAVRQERGKVGEGEGREGRGGEGRGGEGREGKGREGKGREGKGREGEGKGREGRRREEKGRDGTGREGTRRREPEQGLRAALLRPAQVQAVRQERALAPPTTPQIRPPWALWCNTYWYHRTNDTYQKGDPVSNLVRSSTFSIYRHSKGRLSVTSD
ncbi:Hypp3922 [Branchiostoma lanceolatum]|uniref:Hypp3922 protein n=1 Tax=Branchiostoma lanceolatum TaxID=7740 RepID=A0A8K0A4A2_BRALA|nr:Hypp3922 [Branchiostoma lanceolatum]